jgi:hypothetical protein
VSIIGLNFLLCLFVCNCSSSEYGSALSDQDPYGSQYSSDGELYNLESETGSNPSEDSDIEHFGVICEIASEGDSDICPNAQSEDKSKDESERVLTFSERLGVMMDNLFTNKPHFRGVATLRKSSKKIVH